MRDFMMPPDDQHDAFPITKRLALDILLDCQRVVETNQHLDYRVVITAIMGALAIATAGMLKSIGGADQVEPFLQIHSQAIRSAVQGVQEPDQGQKSES